MHFSTHSLDEFRKTCWLETSLIFLEKAYQYILDRDLDLSGKNTYIDFINQGFSCSYILVALIESEEFRKKFSDMSTSLITFVSDYKKAQKRNFVGWYLREIKRIESDFESDVQARRIFRINQNYLSEGNKYLLENELEEWIQLFNDIEIFPNSQNFYTKVLENILSQSKDLNIDIQSKIELNSYSNHTVFQYWDTEQLPDDVLSCMNAWQNLYDGNYRRFNDHTAREFIRNHFSKEYIDAYLKCWHPAMKSDFFRLCYLWIKGGIYVDADEIPKNKFPNIETKGIFLRPIRKKNGCLYFNNSTIIASPRNITIHISLIIAKNLILSCKDVNHSLHEITGPGNLTRSVILSAVLCGTQGIKNEIFSLDFENFSVNRDDLNYKNDLRNWRQCDTQKKASSLLVDI